MRVDHFSQWLQHERDGQKTELSKTSVKKKKSDLRRQNREKREDALSQKQLKKRRIGTNRDVKPSIAIKEK